MTKEHGRSAADAASGHSPKGGAASASPAKPSVPNAVKTVTWYPNKKLDRLTCKLSRFRSVSVALGRTKSRGRTWAVTFKGKTTTRDLAISADMMAALIEGVRRIEQEERLLKSGWQTVGRACLKASAMSASGQDPQGLEAKPASATGEAGDAQP